MFVPTKLRTKMSDVSKKGVFLGIAPVSKAWKILLDGCERVELSCDVLFEDYVKSKYLHNDGIIIVDCEGVPSTC
jgi:hypothetical protein